MTDPTTDYERLSVALGGDTAAAMVEATGPQMVRAGLNPEQAAGILLAALRGLDGTELADVIREEELERYVDATAIHIGAGFLRRLDSAYDNGMRKGLALAAAGDGNMWLLYSHAHLSWWCLGGGGYTDDVLNAGRYDHATAVRKQSWDYRRDRPMTVMVSAPSPALLILPELQEVMRARVVAATETAMLRKAGKAGPESTA